MDDALWKKYPLLTTMQKLLKSRFNAAERLQNRYRWQSLSLVIFSIYSLALSVFPKFFIQKAAEGTDSLGFVAVVSSIFIVALSAYSAFSEDVVRGKYLHDNAKRVNTIYHKYKLSIDEFENKSGTQPDTKAVEAEYAMIMEDCPYNHDQIDYQSIRNQFEKLPRLTDFWIKSKVFLSIYFWPVLAIAGPPIVLVILGMRYVGR